MSDTMRPNTSFRTAATAPFKIVFVAIGTVLIAACAPKLAPLPPPPPPPPAAFVIPARPVPPGNAALGMYIPARDQFGIRRTVNYGLSDAQTLWNLRSALNVAALNCEDSRYPGILAAYSELLSGNERTLRRTNADVTGEFRDRYGSDYRSAFDGYMTQVYNYYALPPTQAQFCEMAAQVALASTAIESPDLRGFAVQNLPRIESVFDNFYTAYEQYMTDVAQWDAQYGPPTAFVAGFAPGNTQAPSILDSTPDSDLYRIEVDPSAASIAPVGAAVPQITGEPVFVAGEAGAPVPPDNSQTVPVFISGEVVEPLPEGE